MIYKLFYSLLFVVSGFLSLEKELIAMESRQASDFEEGLGQLFQDSVSLCCKGCVFPLIFCCFSCCKNYVIPLGIKTYPYIYAGYNYLPDRPRCLHYSNRQEFMRLYMRTLYCLGITCIASRSCIALMDYYEHGHFV